MTKSSAKQRLVNSGPYHRLRRRMIRRVGSIPVRHCEKWNRISRHWRLLVDIETYCPKKRTGKLHRDSSGSGAGTRTQSSDDWMLLTLNNNGTM